MFPVLVFLIVLLVFFVPSLLLLSGSPFLLSFFLLGFEFSLLDPRHPHFLQAPRFLSPPLPPYDHFQLHCQCPWVVPLSPASFHPLPHIFSASFLLFPTSLSIGPCQTIFCHPFFRLCACCPFSSHLSPPM